MKKIKYVVAIFATLAFGTAQAQEASKLSVLDFFYPLPANKDSANYEYVYKYTDKNLDVESYTLAITVRKKDDEITWETYKSIKDCCVGKIGSETHYYRYDKRSKSIILTRFIYEKSGKGVPKSKRKRIETNPNKVVLMMPAQVQVFDVKEAVFSPNENYERSYTKKGELIFRDTTDILNSIPSRFVVIDSQTEAPYDTVVNRRLKPFLIGYDVKEFSRESLPKYADCVKVKLKAHEGTVYVSYYAKGKGLVKTSDFILQTKEPKKKK